MQKSGSPLLPAVLPAPSRWRSRVSRLRNRLATQGASATTGMLYLRLRSHVSSRSPLQHIDLPLHRDLTEEIFQCDSEAIGNGSIPARTADVLVTWGYSLASDQGAARYVCGSIQ